MAAHEHTHDHTHTHDHAHGHSGHDHSHDHHHDEEDSYYIDQLCMIGLAGAFGVICLTMYFWNKPMLVRLLGEQFHPFILASGLVLIFLSMVRAAVLWVEVGKTSNGHEHHGHEHHGHDHEHHHGEACGHDHGPEGCAHDHHDHAHSHEHGHAGHSHADHDHGWAPWRYVVLLVPVMLFLLGVPSQGPKAASVSITIDPEEAKREAQATSQFAASVVAMNHPFTVAAFLVSWSGEPLDDAVPKTFKEIEQAAANPVIQKDWMARDLTVSVTGMFAKNKGNDRAFGLARFSMQCCAGDAVQYTIPVISKEPITHVKPNDWVRVIARVEFVKGGGPNAVVRLRVPGKQGVQPVPPDPFPYIK